MVLLAAAGWVEAFDPGSGRPYYVHLASSTTTWERPTAGPAGAAAAGGAAGGGAGAAAAAAGGKKVYSPEVLALWRKIGDFIRVEATSKITSKNKKFAGLRKVRIGSKQWRRGTGTAVVARTVGGSGKLAFKRRWYHALGC